MADIIDINKIFKIRSQKLKSTDVERSNYLSSFVKDKISLESHILLIHILSSLKEITNSNDIAFINGSLFFDKDVLFHNMSHKEVDFDQGDLKINKSKKHDLVFGSFPFGLKPRSGSGVFTSKNKIDTSSDLIIESLDVIEDGGFGLFLTMPYPKTFLQDKLREHLNKKDFFVNSIIGLPRDFYRPLTSIPAEAIIVSRNKSDNEFILEIESLRSFDFDLTNMFDSSKGSLFIDKNLKNINQGIWHKPGEFPGFVARKFMEKMDAVAGDLRTSGEGMRIGDVCTEMNLGKIGRSFEESENAVYVPLIGNMHTTTLLSELSKKQHNYIQLVVDPNIILNIYLSAFLNTKYGNAQLELIKYYRGGLIPKMSKVEMSDFYISVPSLKVQKKVLVNIEKCENIKKDVDILVDNVLRNPLSDSKSLEQLDSVAQSIGKLTSSDKIKNIISQGESKTVEFKQTIAYCMRSKQKESYIRTAWVKTVAGFLNSDGGDLLVGVTDKQEIVGVNFELDSIFSEQSGDKLDNLFLHVKNIIKQYIGEQFYPLIETDVIMVDESYVLQIHCEPSDKEVFVTDKLKGPQFYVRTNPATDSLEGEKQIEYIRRRFWKVND